MSVFKRFIELRFIQYVMDLIRYYFCRYIYKLELSSLAHAKNGGTWFLRSAPISRKKNYSELSERSIEQLSMFL